MLKKKINKQKRHWVALKRLQGTEERPRLLVQRSLKNFHVQVINDAAGIVLFGTTTNSKDFKKKLSYGGNVAAAKELAKSCAAGLKTKGIKKISFDRAGNQYHGRIKIFADTLREEGIQF